MGENETVLPLRTVQYFSEITYAGAFGKHQVQNSLREGIFHFHLPTGLGQGSQSLQVSWGDARGNSFDTRWWRLQSLNGELVRCKQTNQKNRVNTRQKRVGH